MASKNTLLGSGIDSPSEENLNLSPPVWVYKENMPPKLIPTKPDLELAIQEGWERPTLVN